MVIQQWYFHVFIFKMSLWLYNKISLKTKCKSVVITCRPRRIVVHVLLHYDRFLWRERVSVPRLALHAPATVDCVTIHWQWRARWVSRACSWRRTAQTHNLNLSLQVNNRPNKLWPCINLLLFNVSRVFPKLFFNIDILFGFNVHSNKLSFGLNS